MQTTVTQSQIDAYRRDGFVIIDKFLSTDDLAHWRTAVDHAVRERGNTRVFGHEEFNDTNEFYNNVFVQRVNLWRSDDAMRELMLDPRLGEMAAILAGVDGIRIWHDQALIKQPWANPTSWHLDNPYWSFDSPDAISIWVALDDATLENGCLYFLPGTHKSATYDNVGIGPNMGDLFSVYGEWAGLTPVAAAMKAGSCSFHNGLVAHAAGANMTPGLRRAMSCAYMPDGGAFNGKKNILTPERLAALKIGDVFNDDAENPLIYHKSKPSAL